MLMLLHHDHEIEENMFSASSNTFLLLSICHLNLLLGDANYCYMSEGVPWFHWQNKQKKNQRYNRLECMNNDAIAKIGRQNNFQTS